MNKITFRLKGNYKKINIIRLKDSNEATTNYIRITVAITNINTDADDCSLEVEETVTWHHCVSTAQTFLTQRQRQYEKKNHF